MIKKRITIWLSLKKKINNKMNNIYYKNKQKMKLFFNDLIQNNFHLAI